MKVICKNGEPGEMLDELVSTINDLLGDGWVVDSSAAKLKQGLVYGDGELNFYDDTNLVTNFDDVIYLMSTKQVTRTRIVLADEPERLDVKYIDSSVRDKVINSLLNTYQFKIKSLWEPDVYVKGELQPKKNAKKISELEDFKGLLKEQLGTSSYTIISRRVTDLLNTLVLMGV